MKVVVRLHQTISVICGLCFWIFFINPVYAFSEEKEVALNQQNQALGAYLARAGNCIGCHTTKGGEPFAGGRRLTTTFGIFVTPNITPDNETGIGNWNQDDFWQALHYGKSRDGRLLYPAFPYTEYTKVTRQDANAIFSYLQSLKPVSQTNPPNEIHFPYNLKPLLYLWRKLYFKQGVYQVDQTKSEEWNRGAYLVQGLGHCNACHTTRNLVGASDEDDLAGGQIMGTKWYAPSLTSSLEAGSGDWSIDEMVELLTVGITDRAVASGPMATIIGQSLQYLSQEDVKAMAVYLRSLTVVDANTRPSVDFSVMSGSIRRHLEQGGEIYKQYCQECHGAKGEGVSGVYPPLAGNRSIMMASSLNTIRSVLNGGYPATTKGNPQPYGMPPFQQILHDKEIALVVSYIRNSWGNYGGLVSVVDVEKSK